MISLEKIKDIKINVPKLAGIANLVIVEIHDSNYIISFVENTYPYIDFNFIGKKSKEKNDICEVFDAEISLGDSLDSFLARHKIENYKIIILLNDYRVKSFKVPVEIETIENWLEENIEKVIPGSQNPENFTLENYVYESDEEFKYCIITIIRNSVVNSIIENLDSKKNHLAGIYTDIQGIIHSKVIKNSVYVNFGIDKIKYLMFNEENEFLAGEIYSDYLIAETETDEENLSSFIGSMKNLEEIVFDFFKSNFKEVKYSLSYSQFLKNKKLIFEIQKNNLFCVNNSEVAELNENQFFKMNLKSILYKSDTSGNLIPKKIYSENREVFEKAIFNKLTVFFGGILVAALLFMYFAEGYIQGKITNSQNEKIDVDFKIEKINDLDKQNFKLKKDLKQLSELKKNRVNYSKILEKITQVMNEKSILSNLKIEEIEKNNVKITIKGQCTDQEVVTNFIENMENIISFNDVSLIKSKVIRKNKSKFNTESVEFMIGAKYSAENL